MSDHVAIRPATVDDIPILVRARRLMFEELDDFSPERLDEVDAEFAEYLEREVATGGACGWIAEDTETGEWIGALSNVWVEWPSAPHIRNGRRAYLFGLFVKPAYRRRGVARSLVNTAIGTARDRDAGAVLLHASDLGRPLYESLGFTSTSEMRIILAEDDPCGPCPSC